MRRLALIILSVFLFLGIQASYATGNQDTNIQSGAMDSGTIQDLQKFSQILQNTANGPNIDSSTRQDLLKTVSITNTQVQQAIAQNQALNASGSGFSIWYVLVFLGVGILVGGWIFIRKKWNAATIERVDTPVTPPNITEAPPSGVENLQK